MRMGLTYQHFKQVYQHCLLHYRRVDARVDDCIFLDSSVSLFFFKNRVHVRLSESMRG